MSERKPPASETVPGQAQTVGPSRADVAALVVLGLIVSLTFRGHFVKPHSDFYEFAETGRSLLAGELPASFKRAPLFPILTAAAGRGLSGLEWVEAPEQAAAEWINALLLPLNAVLAYLIGLRWFGRAARWAAVWLIFLPWGVYCTAHVIVEPLLICTVLLTLYAAQRGTRWAYVMAALASITRYDAAGAIVGLAVADLLRREGLGRTALRAALASLPLAIWLTLTAVTWHERSYDHYLAQMGERPWHFDLSWSLGAPLTCVFEPDRIRLPLVVQDVEPFLREGLRMALGLLALLGAAAAVRRRDRAAIAGLVIYAAYTLIHARFPFAETRFGYPLAPLLLLAAGLGVRAVWERTRSWTALTRLGRVLLALTAIFVVAALIGEFGSLPAVPGTGGSWSPSVTLRIVVGLAVVWAAPLLVDRRAAGRLVVLLARLVLARIQVRMAEPLLGTGRQRSNVVAAARWIRDHARPEQRVLSGSPGILRLYCRADPPDRFLGFKDIEAEAWPDILDECRRRGVTYIIWHDQLYDEHGGYYDKKWRLDRFAGLAEPDAVEGVTPERSFPRNPRLWILRVADAP